jgi:hypothetical protein
MKFSTCFLWNRRNNVSPSAESLLDGSYDDLGPTAPSKPTSMIFHRQPQIALLPEINMMRSAEPQELHSMLSSFGRLAIQRGQKSLSIFPLGMSEGLSLPLDEAFFEPTIASLPILTDVKDYVIADIPKVATAKKILLQRIIALLQTKTNEEIQREREEKQTTLEHKQVELKEKQTTLSTHRQTFMAFTEELDLEHKQTADAIKPFIQKLETDISAILKQNVIADRDIQTRLTAALIEHSPFDDSTSNATFIVMLQSTLQQALLKSLTKDIVEKLITALTKTDATQFEDASWIEKITTQLSSSLDKSFKQMLKKFITKRLAETLKQNMPISTLVAFTIEKTMHDLVNDIAKLVEKSFKSVANAPSEQIQRISEERAKLQQTIKDLKQMIPLLEDEIKSLQQTILSLKKSNNLREITSLLLSHKKEVTTNSAGEIIYAGGILLEDTARLLLLALCENLIVEVNQEIAELNKQTTLGKLSQFISNAVGTSTNYQRTFDQAYTLVSEQYDKKTPIENPLIRISLVSSSTPEQDDLQMGFAVPANSAEIDEKTYCADIIIYIDKDTSPSSSSRRGHRNYDNQSSETALRFDSLAATTSESGQCEITKAIISAMPNPVAVEYVPPSIENIHTRDDNRKANRK